MSMYIAYKIYHIFHNIQSTNKLQKNNLLFHVKFKRTIPYSI